MKGEDGRKDPVEAALWFAKAAEQGDQEALYNLGLLHENGEGIPKNRQKDAVFYGRALAAGSAKAAAKTKPVQSALKTPPTLANTAKLAAVNPAASQSTGSPTPLKQDRAAPNHSVRRKSQNFRICLAASILRLENRMAFSDSGLSMQSRCTNALQDFRLMGNRPRHSSAI
jgi:TPR repeat protein